MKISARADYALRACIELARAGEAGSTPEAIAEAQDIPQSFLQNIMGDMRRAGYLRSDTRRRGSYLLASPPEDISIADVLRAMDGPLLRVGGAHPDDLRYPEETSTLVDVWVAVRENLAELLEQVSLLDVATGRFPQGADRPAADLIA